jgi:hypothetical protein
VRVSINFASISLATCNASFCTLSKEYSKTPFGVCH